MRCFNGLLPLALAALLALPVAAQAQGGMQGQKTGQTGTTGGTAGGTTGGTAGGTTGGTAGGTMGGTTGGTMGQGGHAGHQMGGTAGGTTGGTAGGAQAGSVTDPQIAAIVTTANEVDIEAGKNAEKKAKSPEVKKFAKDMVTDHTSLNKQTKDLAKKLKVKPEENETSKTLKENGKQAMDKMKDLKGAEFDRAYVDNEVTLHQQVLDTLDKTLIPSAQNPELKALLEKARPVIAQHLEHAQMLQKSMASK